MYRGDIKMIKNTEIKYSRREAKLIAQILDAARSEFYKDESDRSGSFKILLQSGRGAFSSAIATSYYTTKITSLALTLTEGEED
jgi:hypothetical protein